MSQKRKKRPSGPRSRPASPAGSGAQGRSASRAAPSTAETQLLRQFAAWYTLHLTVLDDEQTHGTLESMHGTLGIFMEMTRTLGPRMTLATPTAHTLQALIDFVLELGADAGAADLDDALAVAVGEQIEALVDVLEHYLDFLTETGAWRATENDIDDSYEVLDQALALYTPERETIRQLAAAVAEVAEVAPTAQLHAMQSLPIVTAVDGLLEWIGRSKPITSTGAVRLGDLQTVAAFLGINAVGKRGAEDSELAHLLYEMATSQPSDASHSAEPRRAGSMWQLSDLSVWWVALSQTGLIEVTATTVRPGPSVSAWRAPDAGVRLAIRGAFLENYLNEWLENEAQRDSISAAQTLTRIVLVLAAAVSPTAFAEQGTREIVTLAEDEFGLAADPAAELSAGLVLHHLRRTGLLVAESAPDGTERLVVPAALRPVIADTIESLISAMV